MRRSRPVGLLLIAGLAGALIVASPLRAALRRAAAAPRCTTGQLHLSLGGGAGAGMSQQRTGVQMRNVGRRACTLDGYPGVSWVTGRHGHQVGPAAQRARLRSHPRTVTLAPGRLASAGLDIVEGDGGLPASRCHPEPVAGLRVYPPGDRTPLYLRLTYEDPAGVCTSPTTFSTLSVGPMVSGAQPGDGGR